MRGQRASGTKHTRIRETIYKSKTLVCKILTGADQGEVKRVNFHPPFSKPPSFFFFLMPQILIGSNTLLQKFTPHFQILDPRLY